MSLNIPGTLAYLDSASSFIRARFSPPQKPAKSPVFATREARPRGHILTPPRPWPCLPGPPLRGVGDEAAPVWQIKAAGVGKDSPSACQAKGDSSQVHQEGLPVTESEFERNIEALRPRLLRYALKLAKSYDAAEDLVQEAIAKAFARLHDYDGRGPIENWIVRIIRNLHIDRLDYEGRRFQTVALSAALENLIPDPSDSPYLLACESMLRDTIGNAIQGMPSTFQPTVKMLFEECDTNEIAQLAGAKRTTVRTRKVRARRLLRAALAVRGYQTQ